MSADRLETSPWDNRRSDDILVIVRRFFESNYFYFLSAALMLLGSYLLMPDKELLGEPFWPTVRSLAILQAYEALVIVTAAVIVRRLGVLDDAFMLLLIELALLLDPTFFSNSFATMLRPEASAVNWLCFALVPIKLAVLQHFLRLRISPRGWVAFLFTAAFVYFAEAPLARPEPPRWIGRDALLYALTWAPVALVCLAPSPARFIESTGSQPDHIEPGRLRSLQWILLLLPAVVLFAHTTESSFVHEMRFYPAYLAPVLIALGVGYVRWANFSEAQQGLIALDALILTALLLASPGANSAEGLDEPPGFVFHQIPALLTMLATVGLYLGHYLRTRHNAALWHIAAMAIALSAWTLWRIDFVRLFVHGCGVAIKDGLRWFVHAVDIVRSAIWNALRPLGPPLAHAMRWAFRHVNALLIVPCAALTVLAIRRRKFWSGFAAAELGVWIVFGFAPGGRGEWIPEWLQFAVIAAIILDHVFDYSRQHLGRYFLAFVVVFCAIGRMSDSSDVLWPIALLGVYGAGFIAAAIALRHPGYLLAGGIAGVVLFVRILSTYWDQIPPAALVVAAALGLFAVGVAVTFNKKRVLQFYDQWFTMSYEPHSPATSVWNDLPDSSSPTTEEEPSPFDNEPNTAPEPDIDMSLDMGRYIEALLMTDPKEDIYLVRDKPNEFVRRVSPRLQMAPGEEWVALIGAATWPSDGGRVLLTNRRLVSAPGFVRGRRSVLYSQIARVERASMWSTSVRLIGHSHQSMNIQLATARQSGCLAAALHRVVHKTWNDFVEEMREPTARDTQEA